MDFSERIAYIKGLMDGMKIDTSDGEGRILAEFADVLAGMAADLEEAHAQIDAVDDDLAGLEEFVYEDLDDLAFDDELCDGNCEGCDGCDDLDFVEGDEDDAEYSVTCPTCGAEFFIDDAAVESDADFECPACGQKIEFYVEDDEEDEAEEG